MTYTKQTIYPYIEKLPGTQVFESTPAAVQAAWEAHRPYHETYQVRKLVQGESEPYLVTLMALKRVTRAGKQTGYYRVGGGYLLGWCGPRYDPKFKIVNSAPLASGCKHPGD